MRIIIAYNHVSIRRLYTDILSLQGHDIVAETGNANDTLRSYFEKLPDLLIIGYKMGQADGIEIIRSIRRKAKSGKIIICTANPDEIKARAINLGEIKILSKPFLIEDFIESVSNVNNSQLG